jgi:predicted RND superfamily exporter protein
LYLQVFTIIGSLILLFIGIYGTAQVKDGLDLTDVVPKDTNEYKFLQAESKYFNEKINLQYASYFTQKDRYDLPSDR